jgi:pectate lyase
VIYNWGKQATILEPYNPQKVKKDKRRPAEMRPPKLNFVGNSWIAEPSTDLAVKRSEIWINNPTEGTAIYLKGNVGPNRPSGTADGEKESALMAKARQTLTEKPAVVPSDVTVQAADAARAAVLRFAGARLAARDAVDERVVREVEAGTGKIIDSPTQVGGYPNYSRGTPQRDSDSDGMPDEWEDARQLNKSRPNANGRDLHAHYDNIEVYINGLFPR